MYKSQQEKGQKIPLQWVLKVVVSSLVLGVTLWLLPTSEVWSAIKNIPFSLWLLVLGLFLMGHAVSAMKWWLLTGYGENVPFITALKAHFAGLVANLCLPGVAGGDVVRAGLIFRESQNKTRVAVGSLADRLLDIFGLFLLSCAGALFSIGNRDGFAGPLVKIGVLFFIVVASILLLVVLLPRLPIKGIKDKVALAMEEFKRQPGTLALCFGLSMLIQSAFISLNIAFAIVSDVNVPAAAWFFAWPLAKLLAVVPISIGGLGVREASLATLLSPLGASPAKVVAIGLLWQTILFAGGLIGGLALLMSAKLKSRATTETDVEGWFPDSGDPPEDTFPSDQRDR